MRKIHEYYQKIKDAIKLKGNGFVSDPRGGANAMQWGVMIYASTII